MRKRDLCEWVENTHDPRCAQSAHTSHKMQGTQMKSQDKNTIPKNGSVIRSQDHISTNQLIVTVCTFAVFVLSLVLRRRRLNTRRSDIVPLSPQIGTPYVRMTQSLASLTSRTRINAWPWALVRLVALQETRPVCVCVCVCENEGTWPR